MSASPALDDKAILELVKKLQLAYAEHGEADAFKHCLYRGYTHLGYKSLLEFSNAVRSYMTRMGIDGRYGDYVRGRITSHNYAGVRPCYLLSKKWNTNDLQLC